MDRHLLTVDEQMDKLEKSIDAINAHLDILIKRENFQDKMITLHHLTALRPKPTANRRNYSHHG